MKTEQIYIWCDGAMTEMSQTPSGSLPIWDFSRCCYFQTTLRTQDLVQLEVFATFYSLKVWKHVKFFLTITTFAEAYLLGERASRTEGKFSDKRHSLSASHFTYFSSINVIHFTNLRFCNLFINKRFVIVCLEKFVLCGWRLELLTDASISFISSLFC